MPAILTNPAVNAFRRGKNAQVVLAGEPVLVPPDVGVSSSKFWSIVDSIKAKLPSSDDKMTRSPSLFEVCTKIQAKEQRKVLSKVKSATESIHQVFKTAGLVSTGTTSLSCAGPSIRVQEHSGAIAHSSHLPASSIPQQTSCWVQVVKSGALPPSRCNAIESIVGQSPRIVHDVFLLSVPSEDNVPSSSSTGHDVQADSEGVHAEPKELAGSSSYAPRPAAMSIEAFEATSEAESDSGDVEEWTDELERKKQAEIDAHIAYCMAALAVPIPNLSALYSCDSLDELASDSSPIRTEVSGTSAPSLDTSFATTVDSEESCPSRGLRRVPNYRDLKNARIIHKEFRPNDFKSDGDHDHPRAVSTARSPVSPSRQLLKGIFRPSCLVRNHTPDSYASHPPPSVWSCAKITRSSLKEKTCKWMTKKSLRALKDRLESMDIDPWD